MRKSTISVAILAAVFGSSMAFAGVTTGIVQSALPGDSITLDNGTVYSLTDESSSHSVIDGFLPGDAVTIHWNMQGDAHDILAISPDFSNATSGQISAIDAGAGTVTLADGMSYNFTNGDGAAYDLTGYQVGDAVSIVPGADGMGRSIAPDFSDGMTGAVQSVDAAAGTLTLADGTMFHFDQDTAEALTGFVVGDMVRVEAHMVGGQHWATAISPA